ncbi:MAG TPA: YlxR family protein [Anaerolineae bacterium]|nr:YlxR family protein [Anaerolineae bacterium]
MRRKHVPQRTCVGCRQVRPKREMIRIVRTPDSGVEIDETGKRAGRGAYLCPKWECWEVALKKERLEHALKVTLTAEERERLWEFGHALKEAQEQEGEGLSGKESS